MSTKEAYSENPLHQELYGWRRDIITHVLQFGLKPGAVLDKLGKRKLRSFEDHSLLHVEGCVMYPPEYAKIDHQTDIHEALCRGNRSLFPVLAERPGEDASSKVLYTMQQQPSDSERHLFSQRCGASFVVVCDFLDINPYYFQKMTTIPSRCFSHLLFPASIWDTHQKDIPTHWYTKSIRIPTMRDERIARIEQPIPVPDYETPLIALSLQAQKRLWIHAVRLPTKEDICS